MIAENRGVSGVDGELPSELVRERTGDTEMLDGEQWKFSHS